MKRRGRGMGRGRRAPAKPMRLPVIVNDWRVRRCAVPTCPVVFQKRKQCQAHPDVDGVLVQESRRPARFIEKVEIEEDRSE